MWQPCQCCLDQYLVFTAIQMCRSCLVILSFFFQSLVSSFIVKSYFIANRRDFLWLEYDRIIAKSGDPNVTAIHVSLNSRLICLARVSRIIAMTCHVQVSLVSVFLWPESGPCLAVDFRTGLSFRKGKLGTVSSKTCSRSKQLQMLLYQNIAACHSSSTNTVISK